MFFIIRVDPNCRQVRLVKHGIWPGPYLQLLGASSSFDA